MNLALVQVVRWTLTGALVLAGVGCSGELGFNDLRVEPLSPDGPQGAGGLGSPGGAGGLGLGEAGGNGDGVGGVNGEGGGGSVDVLGGPAGSNGPGGGTGGFPGPGDVADVGPAANACDGVALGARSGQSLPLTDRQLQNTLSQLLTFSVQLPPLPSRPRVAHAFSTNAAGNTFTLNQVERMAEAAEVVAAQAHDHLDSLLPCTLAAGALSCARRFVGEFGARAFRRPLTPEEADGFVGLYSDLVDDGVTPEVGVVAVIAAILQAPQFLYQLDLGAPGETADTYRLTDHEVASHLSYLLVDSPPDAQLRALAEQGTLTEPSAVRAQAERLLDSSAGQATLKRFITEWFGVDGADHSARLPAELAGAFVSEVDRDLDAWLFGDPGFPVAGLLTASSTHVNGVLADHYGLPAAGVGWQEVELPPEYQGGLLTKGLVASRYASLEESSVIRRGVFVLTELLCASLGTPPDNAIDLNPELPPGSSPRDRSEARIAITPCGSCHSIIDPIGLGMEELDQLGRYRATYATGAAVDNTGELHLLDEPVFAGTAELAQSIASTDAFLTCAVRQWSEYAYGDTGVTHDCTAPQLAASLRGGDASVRELLLSTIEAEPFFVRTGGLAQEVGP